MSTTHAATKTRMAGHVGPGLHYKEVRTTVVLFMASTLFKATSAKIQAAFATLVTRNYDLSGMPAVELELIYASMDDEVMKAARAQFVFIPGRNSVRRNPLHDGVCALCGKGDSKDDGSNADKLLYDFLLTNTHGGSNLWVGANCIVNFGLKVRGAETSEEARAILNKELRQCVTYWKKMEWKDKNPDHEKIPKHFQMMSSYARDYDYYGRHRKRDDDIKLLGRDRFEVMLDIRRTLGDLRRATRFYSRAGYLTESKTSGWRMAKGLLTSLEWLSGVLDRTSNMPDKERAEALETERAERARWVAEYKLKRKVRDANG